MADKFILGFPISEKTASSVLVQDGGNVGIGTTSPDALLHVRAATDVTGTIEVQGGKATVAGVGEVNSELNFGSNDGSIVGGIGGSVKSITEFANGAKAGMGFYTALQGRTPELKEAMRIASNGNVGIGTGTAAPGAKLDVQSSTSSAYFRLKRAYTGSESALFFGSESATNFIDSQGATASAAKPFVFKTGGTERMRIASGGIILIGKTTTNLQTAGLRFDPNGEMYSSILNSGRTSHVYDTTNSVYRFYVTGAGQISATVTSITGISDISLKENIKPLETGLDEVMKLKPRRFDWKNGDGKNIAGFVAQEVEEVLPDLVSDYKYNDNETKKGLKMGDMIPTLVSAIQELKAEIELLKLNN